MRKTTASFHRIDLNKDGVLSRDDIMIYQERAVKFGNMTPHQIEVSAKRNSELIAIWFGADDKRITLEQFLYGCAMDPGGTLFIARTEVSDDLRDFHAERGDVMGVFAKCMLYDVL